MHKYPDEAETLRALVRSANLSPADRSRIAASGAELVQTIREAGHPGLMEVFLAEYGLSTDEGIALMCLAEALLRVPDAVTMDTLIEDKIAPSDWGKHLGHSSSSLVNASTWALMLTGRVLDDQKEPGVTGALRNAIKRLGEPVIRTAAKQAMREMGQQFVLGETMEGALRRAAALEGKGYTYSYDMLGEAARTEEDAERYFSAYLDAIQHIGRAATGKDVRTRPGISVKLSALHPRYEEAQRARVLSDLTPRLLRLLKDAARANIGLNFDAEEADRLELSLDLIDATFGDASLGDWAGFGVVVQAYGLRAGPVIDHLHSLTGKRDRRMMVRLVKGAYWDTEIKLAQIAGTDGFPVFTSKSATDVSYISLARRLLGMTDSLYPQFATHNAHTAAAVLDMADNPKAFEFQRLHGMGEQLHDIVKERHGTRCRIYAPVGAHRDLLAYLVRRLLENGANSSFVNQVVDENVRPNEVAADPFEATAQTTIRTGTDLYLPKRKNAKGWDLADRKTLEEFKSIREKWRKFRWDAGPVLCGSAEPANRQLVTNPSDPEETVGEIALASQKDIDLAVSAANCWSDDAAGRANKLNAAADLFEENSGQFFALLAREAGKTPLDAVGELREAVDFLRYYATQTSEMAGKPLGTIVCISPWNFPLAIFTGQVAGALAAGNAVIAKPAEQTPLVAHLAVSLLLQAGVPQQSLQFLPGDGEIVGRALTSDSRVDGVAFTGSTETAHAIRRAMAEHMTPGAPIVAETGGLNAMIVDSTALLEQAVRDVVASAFQSAGQRCSALRCVYVQEDIADEFKRMLFGAMDALQLGNPWDISTDIGPLIDAPARRDIQSHIEKSLILKQLNHKSSGYFLGPTLIAVDGIGDLKKEVFGPVLHIATYPANALDQVIADINATGFGLTFGLHTRIDTRVQRVVDTVGAGNIYVNRNQIGAIVESQPFGGEGLSGTGPKAGGPWYASRFRSAGAERVDPQREQPGPTGEENRLSLHQRLPLLCLGPGAEQALKQKAAIENAGGRARLATDLSPGDLERASDVGGAIVWNSNDELLRTYAIALAKRSGPILPLVTGAPRPMDLFHERHLCIDTTASGGNAKLLAEAS